MPRPSPRPQSSRRRRNRNDTLRQPSCLPPPVHIIIMCSEVHLLLPHRRALILRVHIILNYNINMTQPVTRHYFVFRDF